ncbi:hypothetical protein EUGRSUZ_H01813, partial [Eucalyptus grandis]
MASSSSKLRKSYHVFLNFRGLDVRNYFLGHLYTALNQAGINTYKDDEELRKGEHISTELQKAIEESCITIVVFSKHYASSMWCLEEMSKIMECKEKTDLMVYPMFYKSYFQDMAKHENNVGKDLEKVKRWKKALLDAGNLSGWHFTDGY